ncbi:hypothetical protein ACFYP4_02650 [Streptomyces sp. NPDC005551]|uniref:hypothetical protein n=1 Tax=Streptomyces sp. NPDC005551 TaxID=3364725 RepID=UPI0036B2CA44
MTIAAGSRYANNAVQPILGRDGITRQTIMARQASARVYTVVDYVWNYGDRPDLIAGQAYGDETMWWVIAQANPQILDWTELAPGTVVRIPNGVS